MRFFFFFVLVIISFAFYRSENAIGTRMTKIPTKKVIWTDSLPFLDTVVLLSHVDNSNFAKRNLNRLDAERILYSYFKIKGILTKDQQTILKAKNEQLFIDYDTFYIVRTSNFSGAVISYWVGPADLNGHCFQPRKAIIRHTLKGYKLTDEDFVPINFYIDSVVKSDIYGYIYDCGRKGLVGRFRVKLK